MTLTAGIIGCGNISRFYFSGLEKYGAKVKWICDLVEEKSRPWTAKYNASYTPDYKNILADKDVNVVIITCITSAHKQICIDAIDSGKAVICEKTLSQDAANSLEIVRHAQQKQTIFYTAYMKRFIPAVEQAAKLLPSLGRIISTRIQTYQPWGDLWDKNPAEGFFHTPPGGCSAVKGNYGGGILQCGGSHLLDLVLFLLGRPIRLYASQYTPGDRDYDLHAVAMIETANGIVQYEALAHPLKKIGFLNDGWDEQIKIVGTKGTLEVFSAMWDQSDVKASKLLHYDNATANTTTYMYDAVSPFDRSVAFFCSNIARGQQGTQSKLTGYEVDELIETIQKSASARQAIEINWRI